MTRLSLVRAQVDVHDTRGELGGEPWECRLTISLPDMAERAEDYVEDLRAIAAADWAGVDIRHNWLTLRLRFANACPTVALPALVQRVRATLRSAVVIAAVPDLVTLHEAAERVGMPVACFEELADECGFPSAVLDAHWRLIDLLRWVRAIGAFAVDPGLVALAQATALVNEHTSHGRPDLLTVAGR